MVQQYLDHSRAILSSRDSRFKFNERRGLGRIYLFGYQNRYDLKEGFPLLTTKKMGFKTIAHELIWFLSGKTNIRYLAENKVHIWDDDSFNHNLPGMVQEGIFSEKFPKYSGEWIATRNEYVKRVKEDPEFAQRWGDLGPVYGSQWIHWPKYTPVQVAVNGEPQTLYSKDEKGINQIDEVIRGIKKDALSARHMVTAWNPDEVPGMALPPCHCLFQVNSDGKKLDLMLNQRACDMFLGVPFNIASYALLTTILADQTGLEVGNFVHTFGDVHFYTGAGERAKWYRDNFDKFKGEVREAELSGDYLGYLDWLKDVLPPEEKGREGMDHVTGILEQLSRTPRELPKIKVKSKPYSELTIDDFVIEGYDPWPKIERTLAV
jgi:thymidylate synthase